LEGRREERQENERDLRKLTECEMVHQLDDLPEQPGGGKDTGDGGGWC
jgi:hypothetical protein